jgi:DNA-binding SARP family transcriptional activator/tetratricopeptide (TPR) repeat protein
MAMEFRLLGDVEVRIGGQPIDPGHARQRAVLAVLLTEVNRVVPSDQLIDRVWGERRLPADPPSTLQTYMSILRRVLSPARHVTITRQSAGYKLTADPETVDLHRFSDLIARARAAKSEHDAFSLFGEALSLWRGEPFAGLDAPWFNGVRATLIRERHAARLDLTDIQLRRGQHAALLTELAAQASEHPLDERIAGQYMLALNRSGRQADALALYRQVRQCLAEEIGVDPGPPLQRLHQQILTADPVIAAPADASTGSAPPAVPRQLPTPLRLFTGRAPEMARLTAALNSDGEAHHAVVISAIGGTGGIGKTALALQWAHQHLDQFPDGQLWVDLRGFDPSGEPLSTQAALHGFLVALGVPSAAIPPGLQAQSGLYRSLLAGKRMLVVLDNAAGTSQVLPLLPGSAGCAALVTSRSHLVGLVTACGALSVDLGILTEREAHELLARQLGDAPLAAEPEAAAELLARCGGLPLAVSVVAARAAAHPGFPLAALVADLRDATTCLDALDTGDAEVSVREVLSWSCRRLEPRAATMFGLLGLAPGPDISVAAAASLSALPIPQARAVLQNLENVSLVQQHAPGRYRMHDLVRLYAAEQVGRPQPQGGRTAALLRVMDFYLHTAFAGDRLLHPNRQPIDLGQPVDGCIPQQHGEAAAALAWFDSEHENLRAAQTAAAEHGWYTRTWQLAWAMNAFHTFRGYFRERIITWQAGLAAAEHLGQPVMQSLAHGWLGQACAHAGRHDEAVGHIARAITLAENSGDTASQAHGYLQLSRVWGLQGKHIEALSQAVRALPLFQALGHLGWEAQALNEIGWHQAHLGQFNEARASCEAALALYHRLHNREG